MKKNCCIIDAIAKILLIVGGLNWGLVGIANFDLVAHLFGEMNLLTRLVYIIVAASALWLAFSWCCCKKKSCDTQAK